MTIDLAAGAELAGHRIDAVIGRGGMGVVYLAQHLRLGRKVALKVLVPALAQDEVFRERFIRESQLAAALEHPNIIPIYDAGDVDEVLYISMRYVEGPDLSVVLHQEKTLSAEDTLSILEQVASALDAAHEEGLVHRDVKPANVLMDDRSSTGRRVFLTDFGITKSLRREGDSLTRAGQLVGTIDYMAPEQITGQPVDARTDVYSLGCIAYRCLAGTAPYPRDNQVAVMYAHLQDTPAAITASRPELPGAVDRVVRKAMAKGKHARFATCTEFIEALRREIAPFATSSPALPGQPAARPPQSRRRSRRRAVAGALAMAALVGGVIAAVISSQHPASTAGAQSTPSSPATGASSGPTLAITPSPPPTESAPPQTPVQLVWKRVGGKNRQAFGGPGNQTINRALVTSTDILAVGYDSHRAGGDNDAAVWTATKKGLNWSGETPDSGGGPGDQGMAGLAKGGPGYVAVGTDRNDAAVWTSPDGGSWREFSPKSPNTFGGRGIQGMRRVVAAGPGLVAVGYSWSGAGVDAAAWTFDGEDWTKWRSAAFGGRGNQVMISIAQHASTLVVVGSDDSKGDLDAAAWVSSDGKRWTRVPPKIFRRRGDQEMTTVVQGGPGFVAVGYDSFSGDKDAAVWTSTDGTDWTLVPSDPINLGGPHDQRMIGVTTIGRTLVAVGWRSTGDDIDGAAWESTDGITWTLLDSSAFSGPGAQQIKSVIRVGDDRLVAVGRERSATNNEDVAVWVATIKPGER